VIIEIALGIVLAVLVLAFFPALLRLGAILVGVVLVVLVAGLLLYWIVSNPTIFLVLLVLVLVLLVLVVGAVRIAALFLRDAPIRALREQIRRRQTLGYDTTELEASLEKAIIETARVRTEKRQSKTFKSRRELGYTDKPDDT